MIDVLMSVPNQPKVFPSCWVKQTGHIKRFDGYIWQPTQEKQEMGRIPFNILTEEIYGD